jgi:hypothetical protein
MRRPISWKRITNALVVVFVGLLGWVVYVAVSSNYDAGMMASWRMKTQQRLEPRFNACLERPSAPPSHGALACVEALAAEPLVDYEGEPAKVVAFLEGKRVVLRVIRPEVGGIFQLSGVLKAP